MHNIAGWDSRSESIISMVTFKVKQQAKSLKNNEAWQSEVNNGLSEDVSKAPGIDFLSEACLTQ